MASQICWTVALCHIRRFRWVSRTSVACAGVLLAAATPAAWAHGVDESPYRTRIVGMEPAGVPVDVRVVDDRIRFENLGSRELELCGYEAARCDPWVRLGPDGVFEDRASAAWRANRSSDGRASTSEGAGGDGEQMVRVRRSPAFYAYHDHRVHWMGGDRLPPGVDEGDPRPQLVNEATVRFRYGGTPGAVHVRLEYVGGRTWLERYGEYALTATAVVLMLGAFVIDARRRRRARPDGADQSP